MSIDLIEPKAATVPPGPMGPALVERRQAPRFEAVADRIWLGWWDGEQFRTVGAQLVDLSRTGAAIATPEGPARGEDAWFCVVGPRLSAGARARVVGLAPIADGPPGIRLSLAFPHQCPADVFEIALGIISGRPSPGDVN